jgi:hypothetical protein
MKNLTYDQLIELAPKDRPFQIKIDVWISNNGNDGKKVLWAYIIYKDLWIIFEEYIRGFWKDEYKGTFTLIDPRYQKPEVLKVGQKVRIMESARECGDYETRDELVIGKVQTIRNVRDGREGIQYGFDYHSFPHYCVMPVEEEEVQEIPELENTLEQLDNLVSKAQDIISKYKK